MPALRAVVEKHGWFAALYSDRASHFFVTPQAGGKIDPHRLTQVGRALKELGIKMIPAYSPQARGRQERNYRTWQGRLPQELRIRGIGEVEAANRFLREEYMAEFNRRFAVSPASSGTAFIRLKRRDLDWVFSIQHERRVNNDNTITLNNRVFDIAKTRWRNTLAGSTVMVHELLNGDIVVRYGPREVARFKADQLSAPKPMQRQAPRPFGHKRPAA
jgi:hypothetical protein